MAEEVLIGDLEDLETQARERGCDLLVTHSHGRQAAERLNIPFYRAGMPMFDRLGAGHQTAMGYRGTRDTIFAIANLIIADHEAHHEPPRTPGGATMPATPAPCTETAELRRQNRRTMP